MIDKLSYSGLSLYLESPLRFFLKYIAKLPATDDTVECYGVAGNLVHSWLEQYAESKLEIDEISTKEDWAKAGLNNMYDLRGQTLPYSKYYDYYIQGIGIINAFPRDAKFKPELEFEYNILDVKLNGFIDLVVNDSIIIDWKTDSKSTHDKHLLQRKFYTFVYWRMFGKLPQTQWHYLSHNNVEGNSFTEEDMIEFQSYLVDIISEINSKGDDVTVFDKGNINSPFNIHKTLCKMSYDEIKEYIKGVDNMVDLKKSGENLMMDESSTSVALREIKSDKYSKGAMIGAYMNHWTEDQLKQNGKLPTFEEFVKKNAELRAELEKIE